MGMEMYQTLGIPGTPNNEEGGAFWHPDIEQYPARVKNSGIHTPTICEGREDQPGEGSYMTSGDPALKTGIYHRWDSSFWTKETTRA